MSLVSQLRGYDRKLKKYCRKQAKNDSRSKAQLWVCENYRLCSSALEAAVRFLSSEGEKNLEPLFLLCKEIFLSGKEITRDRIIGRLSRERPDIRQCEALEVLFFAAAVSVICERLGEEAFILCCLRKLNALRDIDFLTVIPEISRAERLLCDDPSGIYEKMSDATKKHYRAAVIRGAQREKISEEELLRRALRRARNKENGNNHIGFFLPLNEKKRVTGWFFIALQWAFSGIMSIFLSLLLSDGFYMSLLLFFPVFAILRPLSDRISSVIFPPFFLPSMDEDRLTEGNTLITVSTLVSDGENREKMFSRLSSLYSSCSLENIKVMLLADRKNCKTPEAVTDEEDVRELKELIDSLNMKHEGGFCLAVRDRVYSPTEEEYIGFERKRGAICTLAGFLRDKNSQAFPIFYGDVEGLEKMRYILALDSDSSLPFEGIRRLVAAAVHPLNKPLYDSEKKRIVRGYGIYAPCSEISAESGAKSYFARIFTTAGSLSYEGCVHEKYSAMFSCSIFCGKGLIDIDAFNKNCVDRFDEHRILSHDILEGAVMRTALVSDLSLTEDFPSSFSSYYKRLHRWIRGDIQNLKYIFLPLGKRGMSPSLPITGKYQLLDNFIRAFTPVNILFLILFSLILPEDMGLWLMLTVIFSLTSEQLIALFVTFLRNKTGMLYNLYFSDELSFAQKEVLKAVMNVGNLPQHAVTCADAIIRGVWRSVFSKKHLLQWTVSAEENRFYAGNTLRNILFPLICAVLIFAYGTALHRLISLLMLLSVICELLLFRRPCETAEKKPSRDEKKRITEYVYDAWRFFGENVNAGGNYLPPDNICLHSAAVTDPLTSPTNIGLYLVSVLAAADFSFISSDEMLTRLENTLSTVEGLPKYKGALYNRYDIRTPEKLPSFFVSFVDCGNFLVCLTALRRGLEEYISFSPKVLSLCERIDALTENTDLSFLYDKKRGLYRTGFDSESGSLTPSFYDLYMSEARMGSYYECAKRHAPVSHWRALGRIIRREGGYIAAASWTGTMFEYLMPSLFLEALPGSFQYETMTVSLHIQKRQAGKMKIPYGISESCCYEEDASGNFVYKAHGIKSLALKTDMTSEAVVSPYSCFLSLPFDTKGAVKNLDRLSSLGGYGKYGFYEALDFRHCEEKNNSPSVVKSYMSHHVGMSIIAGANTVFDNVFVKRFMSDGDMNQAAGLLREKIPMHPASFCFPGVFKLKKPVIKIPFVYGRTEGKRSKFRDSVLKKEGSAS